MSAEGLDPDRTQLIPTIGGRPTTSADATQEIRFVDATQEIPIRTTDSPDPVEQNPTATALATEDINGSVARHSSLMALGSIISRVTGLVRTTAIGAAIGAAAVGDAYNQANLLPGMVYELLLGGVLASTVVPLIVRARARDTDQGEAFVQRLLTLAVVFLAGATVVAVACAPIFTWVVAGSSPAPYRHLITTLAYLLLPMIFFYGMAALFAAVLNTRNHFAMPTFAPILNNLVVIGMATTFIVIPLANKGTDPATVTGTQIIVLGLGTTLGIVVQAAGLLPALRRVHFRWKWRWDFRQLHLGELGRIGSWMLVYVIGSQVALLVVQRLAQNAANAGKDVAGPAVFNNAYLIFMMAHGIVAVSIITVLMPRMASAAAAGRNADQIELIAQGTRLIVAVMVPITIAYLVLGRPLSVTLFQWGNYDHREAVATGWVVAVGGLGLIPFAISQLQLFSFYARTDTRTPALINIPVVVIRMGVDLVLYAVLPSALVAAGLMAGNGISFFAAAVLGYILLRKHIGRLGLRRTISGLVKLAAAGVIAGLFAGAVVLGMSVGLGDGKVSSLIQLAVGGVALVVMYAAMAMAFRVPEVHQLAGMIRARLHR